MKRSVTLLAASLALCAVLAACAPSVDITVVAPPATEAPQAQNTPDVQPSPQDNSAPPASQPDLAAAEKDVEAMLPIMDSITRAMGTGQTIPYGPENEEFFWSVLYLMGENWGHTHPLVEKDGDVAVVPRQVMQEFAGAAFYDYDDLPPLPESYANTVKYDSGLDAYRLEPSDMGDAQTKLEAVAAGQDGAITATVGLYGGLDEPLGTLAFTLLPNPYADAISEPAYLYTVSGVSVATP